MGWGKKKDLNQFCVLLSSCMMCSRFFPYHLLRPSSFGVDVGVCLCARDSSNTLGSGKRLFLHLQIVIFWRNKR